MKTSVANFVILPVRFLTFGRLVIFVLGLWGLTASFMSGVAERFSTSETPTFIRALASVGVTPVYAEEGDKYYWTGATNNTYNTGSNWSINGVPYEGALITGSPATFDKDCYILTSSGDVVIDWSNFGVASLTVGNGTGGDSGTAGISRSGAAELKTKLTINKGGTATFGGAFSITDYNSTPATLTIGGGTFNGNTMTVSGKIVMDAGNFSANSMTVNGSGSVTINGGTFTYSSSDNFVNNGTFTVAGGEMVVSSGSGTFRVGGDNNSANFNVTGGKVTVNTTTYIATSSNGTFNQSNGETVFNGDLILGWGNYTGTYNLSGGTITTNRAAGLWNANNSVNIFNVDGGTANFNYTGESFTVGYGGSNQRANTFNLRSGVVNAADTFAVKYGGKLNVDGDGVLNAKKIEINTSGTLDMTAGTINLGEGGITSSDNAYTFNLSGGTLATNGASWSSALNATLANTTTFSAEADQTITWSGVLSGTGALTKTGAGTLELTGANTYTGKTTVSAGTLKLSGSGKLASTEIDVATGTTLLYDNTVPHNTAPLTINVNGGTLEFYNTTVTDTHTNNNGICSGVAGQEVTINGTGATLLIDGGGTVSAIAGSGKSTVTFALDSSSVFHVQNGYFINGGYATQDWTNNQAELRIGATGKVECWDGAKMQFGGLSGEAGAQLVNIKSGKGMSIGNGVTANQSYTYNGIISLNGKNIDFNGAGKQTLNGDITAVNMYNKAGTLVLGTAGNELKINSGVVVKSDGGAVQVNGNLIVESGNFYPGGTWSTGTGTVTLKSGTQMRVGGTFGPTIGIKLDGGLLFNDGDNGGKTATVSSPVTVLSDSQLQSGWNGGSLTFTGALSGSGGLTICDDQGQMYISGTGSDNYTGSWTISANVRIGVANTAAVDASTYVGKGEIIFKRVTEGRGIFMNNDNFLTFSNNLNFEGDSYLQAGWTKDMTFTGNIKGSGKLEVMSDSGWIIMGTHSTDNAFTGDVQVDYKDSSHYGQLRLAADQPFGANAGTGKIYGKLDMNGYSQIFKGLHNDADKQPIFNNSTTLSTLTLDTTGQDWTFNSSIQGNIALVIKGTGKQTLSKAVAYTGSTTIESGTLALTATSGTNKLYNLSGAGNLDYGSSPLELFNTADTVFSGKLSGSGKLTFQNGSGWIELGQTADETFTGNVQINYANSNSQGRVRLGADNALGTANRAFIYGTLDMNGHNQSFAGLSNDGNKGPIFNDTDTLSTLTIDNISEDLKFQSSISGNVALVLTGTENGKLTLAKAPEYTGATTVEAGTLALSQGGTLYNLSGGSADSAAAIDSTGKNLELVNTENTKFIGSIAAAAITKTGEGTLKVNGTIDASSLTVTGGRFDLKGNSSCGLTISNAVFSPGNSVGAAEVGGAFTLTDGASVILEIGGATPDKNDSLVASGELQLNDGKIYLTFADACELQSGGQFTAVFSGSNSASIKDNFIDNYVVSDYFINLQYVPYGNGQYAITGILDPNVVPEPSAWILLLFGAFGLLYWRKRQ